MKKKAGRKPLPKSAKDAWASLRMPEYTAILADGLGISKAAVSKWKQVPVNRVADVARILGLPQTLLRPDLPTLWAETPIADYLEQSTQGKP